MARALKRIRIAQPFNRWATSSLRLLAQRTGVQPRFVVRYLPPVGLVSQPLPTGGTLRLWTEGDDQVARYIYWLGWWGYEAHGTPLFFEMARRSRVVLDVGAYVGIHAILAGHANPQAAIYAFEPLEAVFTRLARNVALNGLDNVRCFHAAAGEQNQQAQFFHVAEGLPTSSSLSSEFMHSWPSVAGSDITSSIVPVLKLDDFIDREKVGKVDLVKIDTETTEPEVLRGMERTLRSDRPHLMCEVLPGAGTAPDLERLLGPLGYRYYALTTGGPRPRADLRAGVGHDYLCTTLDEHQVLDIAAAAERLTKASGLPRG
ncbi:MAG: FkbM family methyltransferase [Chloroflexota bacterium]